MKVSELTARSTFTSGKAYDTGNAPRVSVLLPTFRRGDSGLLARAIASVLGQTFRDLELIIVDDASVDSTREIIADAMRKDPRVSVIRHAENIGLPAVSEYEAYMKARGDLIAFAFDDTVFYPDAIEALVRASDSRSEGLVAGYAKFFYRPAEGGEIAEGSLGRDARPQDLISANMIPNCSVMLPRSVIEVVGLYDPHVCLARLCDYDLWLRVRRRFPIHLIDVCTGEEHGPITDDSLGSTYPLDAWLADDRIRMVRDEALVPARYGDVDVFSVRSFASHRSRQRALELAQRHVAARTWMTAPSADIGQGARVPRVVVLAHSMDASEQLVFEALRDVPDLHVRIVDSDRGELAVVAPADVVIVSRVLRGNEHWIDAALAAGIPLYYYIDDNLPLMAKAGEIRTVNQDDYAIEYIRDVLSRMRGVLAATPALAESLSRQELHKRVEPVDIAAPPRLALLRRDVSGKTLGEPTVALFVGIHRKEEVAQVLLPALAESAQGLGVRVRLLVPRKLFEANDVTFPSLSIEEFERDRDYVGSLAALASRGVDAVVVPGTRSVNAKYKTLHPLITAAALNAAIVLPSGTAYEALRGERGVWIVDAPGDVPQWREALSAMLTALLGPQGASARVPVEIITDRFEATARAVALMQILGADARADEPDELGRLQAIANRLALQLVAERVWTPTTRLGSAQQRRVARHPDFQNALRDSLRTEGLVGTDSLASRVLRRVGWRGAVPSVKLGAYGVSAPLNDVPYVVYKMTIPAGRHRSVSVGAFGTGVAGEFLGVEIVSVESEIVCHSATMLPARPGRHMVTFETDFDVPTSATYEVRFFVRAVHPVYLVERLRGALGEPQAVPVVTFDPQ